MAGAATNPDPDVFAYAAAQVKNALDVTHELGGANYVLWGGREGYETLLNTDMKRELDQLGRFLTMVVEHKHKIGFKGTILIEPKPKEPTKHQYDFDVGTIYGMLKAYGLEKEVKINIEQNHAILAGHSFEHEIAARRRARHLRLARPQPRRRPARLGHRPVRHERAGADAGACYEILKAGGFTTGGMNFDAKIRRQSIEPDDLLHAHVGSMDATRAGAAQRRGDHRGRHAAEVRRRALCRLGRRARQGHPRAARRASTTSPRMCRERELDPQPKSGRQEYLENLVNRFS